ncbi:MAG: hypothetical protein ACE5HF_10490 [Gemmatimonadota bacterium]
MKAGQGTTAVRTLIALGALGYAFLFALDPMLSGPPTAMSLALYRAGQGLFAPLGSTAGLVGGTLAQLCVPIALAGAFGLAEKNFASALVRLWVAQNIFNVSAWMRDSLHHRLPERFPAGPVPDWAGPLRDLGLEGREALTANILHGIGLLVFFVALLRILRFAPRRAPRK